MPSFQAKIGWKTPRKREYKKYRSVSFLPDTIMAQFLAKIGWKTQRKRENKNCHSVLFRSYPTGNIKFQKNRKKIQKIKKYHYGFISSQNR